MATESKGFELRKLADEFKPNEIEWRIQRSGSRDGKPWAKVVAYITNRAIMDRLDNICGPGNWKNEFTRWGEHGVLCGISIYVNSEWVTKWDGAEETSIEAVKGGFSASMKRAAVQWGMGRYLYEWDESWAVFNEKGKYSAKIDGQYHKWNPPGKQPESGQSLSAQYLAAFNKAHDDIIIDDDEKVACQEYLNKYKKNDEAMRKGILHLNERRKEEEDRMLKAMEVKK